MTFVIPIVYDLILIAGMVMIGWFASGIIMPSISKLARSSLSFLLGAGLSSWSIFILGWIGIPIRWPWMQSWMLFMLIVSGWLNHRVRQSRRARLTSEPSKGGFRWSLAAMGVFLALAFCYLGYISAGRSYSTFDALSMWAPKGYGIAYEGSLWGAVAWGNHKLAYPLNIQLLIASFRIFSGDVLPGSKLIFPLYFISYLLFTFDYLRRRQVGDLIALAITLTTATVPLFVLHATIGYANLAMAAYLIPGLLWLLEGVYTENSGAQFLGSLLLGFTVWTIIEGVLYVGAGLAALAIAYLVVRKGTIRWIDALAPLLVVGGAWLLFYLLYAAEESQAVSAFDQMWSAIRSGQIDFSDIRLIFGYARRNIFDVSTWGYLFPAGLVIIVLSLRQLKPRQNAYGFSLALVVGSLAALSLGLFYLRSFAIEGLYDLLVRGFPRGFMSAAMLFVILYGSVLPGSLSQAGNLFEGKR
jgi:hypothetical protein